VVDKFEALNSIPSTTKIQKEEEEEEEEEGEARRREKEEEKEEKKHITYIWNLWKLPCISQLLCVCASHIKSLFLSYFLIPTCSTNTFTFGSLRE
jgi:ABC-type Zn2+ transport system substrate-binding protein/surface adhesin